MPTLAVERDALFASLGRTYTDEEFDELCFEFGIELDEITSEREEEEKSSKQLSKKQLETLSTNVIYKIDMPANRYDLLCIEGLSRALQIFLGDRDAPIYSLDPPIPSMTLTVKKANTDTIRPFCVAAILRDVTIEDRVRYNSLIDLQDQLHRNLCRRRTLVAIGTHDYDTIKGPFVYDARPPSEINFVPLTPSDKEYTATELIEKFENDAACKHLKPYVPIIKDSPLYPVVLDSNETVLSLPPLINGDHSKIKMTTKNIFIECTATDLTKANIVLDTLVTMLSEHCAKPFTVEPVTVQYEDSSGSITSSYVTPVLSTRRERAGVDFCNSLIGINVPTEEMVALCNKVQLGPATAMADPNTGEMMLEVNVPPTRSDILHAVDIAEDIGIAYGYNKIVKRVPKTCTVGGEFPLNALSDLLRDEIARAGYTEVLTHGLCSVHDNFSALQRPVDAGLAVSLSNPANREYEVVRTTLLPGLLKTLQHNKSQSFSGGFSLFEISDVVLRDNTKVVAETIVGARNERHLSAVYSGPTSGFEIIHGLVDRVLTLTEITPNPSYAGNSVTAEDSYRISRGESFSYRIEELKLDSGDPNAGSFFPGRAARILVTTPTATDLCIGSYGVLHPKVLSEFDIRYPTSAVELNLEALLPEA